MLERQHLTVKDYDKDQKAYASMLNKMYVAAKEGEWTGLCSTTSYSTLNLFKLLLLPRKVAFPKESFCGDLLTRFLVSL